MHGFVVGMAIVMCGLVLVLPACGNESGRVTHKTLSADQQRQVDSAVSRLQEEVGFVLLKPTYLPAGLRAAPSVDDKSAKRGEAFFSFISDSLISDSESTPRDGKPGVRYLIIIQRLDADHKYPEDPDATPFDLDGLSGAETADVTGSNSLTHDLRFRVGDLYTILQVDWGLGNPSPMRLTDDMRSEDLEIAKSMLPED